MMDQEKIGKAIREIRMSEKLSQQKFAEKYGVTYQAVSKWENGKNMPDIVILKQICNDYQIDLNSLMEAKVVCSKKKVGSFRGILICGGCFLFLFLIFIVVYSTINRDFDFKVLSTTCDNFNLYGSIAYNDNKTAINISHITYCGEDDLNYYQSIDCILYEVNGKTKTEISQYSYQKNTPIMLVDFLKNVSFKIDHYDKSCKVYRENSLHLEIEALREDGQIITYKIPLKLEENCNR